MAERGFVWIIYLLSCAGQKKKRCLSGVFRHMFQTELFLLPHICYDSAEHFSEKGESGTLHLPSGWASLTYFPPQPTPHLGCTKISYHAFGDTDFNSAASDPRGARGVKSRVSCRTQTLSSLPLLNQKTSPLNTYLVDLRQLGTKPLLVRSHISNSTLKPEARYGVMCMQKNTQLSRELPYPALTSTFRMI